MPQGKYKGRHLEQVARDDPAYFQKIITTPNPNIKVQVDLWVQTQINKPPDRAPIGTYGGRLYDLILEMDPAYIFRALDGKEAVISKHILRWGSANLEIIQSLKNGFLGENLTGLILGRILAEKSLPPPQREFSIRALPTRRYDYKFNYEGARILLEYDGEQHFEFTRRFHASLADFNAGIKVDQEKTAGAIANGYKIIRIAYPQFSQIRTHIQQALVHFSHPRHLYYFSDPHLYRYHMASVASR
jgi:hypothetical protein